MPPQPIASPKRAAGLPSIDTLDEPAEMLRGCMPCGVLGHGQPWGCKGSPRRAAGRPFTNMLPLAETIDMGGNQSCADPISLSLAASGITLSSVFV